jgi:hypothetical protein
MVNNPDSQSKTGMASTPQLTMTECITMTESKAMPERTALSKF